MATSTYSRYPTPPPTSSPKQHNGSSPYPSQSQQQLPAQDTYYKTSYSAPGSPTQSRPPWEAPAASKISMNRIDAGSGGAPPPALSQPGGLNQDYYLPPRRRSSPIPGQQQKPYPHDQYFNPPGPGGSTIQPPRRRSSPGVSPNANPRPLHFSPVNPVPTPFNASRPQPRPGLVKRMMNKLKAWARGFVKWCRNNPVKAGLLTFIPVLAGAGMVKMFKSAAKVLGVAGIAIMEGMGGGRTPGNWEGKKEAAKDAAKGAESAAEKEWGYGLDEFKGFAGSKAGPVEGFMKVMQMMMNHYCKLSPSAVPRAASILLELYFLEKAKL